MPLGLQISLTKGHIVSAGAVVPPKVGLGICYWFLHLQILAKLKLQQILLWFRSAYWIMWHLKYVLVLKWPCWPGDIWKFGVLTEAAELHFAIVTLCQKGVSVPPKITCLLKVTSLLPPITVPHTLELTILWFCVAPEELSMAIWLSALTIWTSQLCLWHLYRFTLAYQFYQMSILLSYSCEERI